MADDEIQTALLTEIRDLLIPIAAHYRPEFEKQLQIERGQKVERLPQIVRGKQARKACLMMDGSNDQAAIRRDVGIASGNLSSLISRLEGEGMLAEGADRRMPQLIFSQRKLVEIFGEQV